MRGMATRNTRRHKKGLFLWIFVIFVAIDSTTRFAKGHEGKKRGWPQETREGTKRFVLWIFVFFVAMNFTAEHAEGMIL